MSVVRNAGNLPAPDGNDPVRNGDNVMKLLADTIVAQQPRHESYDMGGGNIAAGGTGTFLAATPITAVGWDRIVIVTVNHTVVSGTAYVDFTLRQGAVEVKKARASAGGSVSITTRIDLPANTSTSINVQATSSAAAVLISDARWAHVEVTLLPKWQAV